MNLRFHWRLLEGGEDNQARLASGRYDAVKGQPDLETQVDFCRDAELAGIDALLVDVGFAKPDPMTLAMALARRTATVAFMVACRPGLMSPTLFVQQVNTFSAIANGRISLNVVAGHSAVEMAYFGDSLDHDSRYARMDEFLAICREFWGTDQPVNFSGNHFAIREGRLRTPFVAATARAPEIFVGGNSGSARDVAARRADCWMRFPLAPDRLAAEIRPVLDAGKQVGLRLAVIARSTRDEALAAARELIADADDAARDLRSFVQLSDSHAVRSIDYLAEQEWLTPCLWTGAVSTLGVTNVCLLGSYDEVAAQLVELGEIGVSQFILSGWPKWDEMVRFGREVIPRVHGRQPVATSAMASAAAARNGCQAHVAPAGERSGIGSPSSVIAKTRSTPSIDRLFSRTVCINLDRRPDRWRKMEDRFSRLGMRNVQRVSAVDGKQIQVPGAWAGMEGAYGCLRSHLSVIEAAARDGIDRLLILEDDAEFAPDFITRLGNAFEELPDDWSILYLCGSHRRPPVPLSDSLAQASYTLSTLAYAVSRTAFREILTFDHALPEAIDVRLAEVQSRRVFHCVRTNLAWPDLDYSDVQGAVTNHWYIRESLVIGDSCGLDMVGRVALIIPVLSPAWRCSDSSAMDYVINYFREAIPEVKVVRDSRPALDVGPEDLARRVSADLDETITYLVVAGSPVFFSKSHLIGALEMCRRHATVSPFCEVVPLSQSDVRRVLSGNRKSLDLSSYSRVRQDGLELGWGFFQRDAMKEDMKSAPRSAFEVPSFALDLRGQNQPHD